MLWENNKGRSGAMWLDVKRSWLLTYCHEVDYSRAGSLLNCHNLREKTPKTLTLSKNHIDYKDCISYESHLISFKLKRFGQMRRIYALTTTKNP